MSRCYRGLQRPKQLVTSLFACVLMFGCSDKSAEAFDNTVDKISEKRDNMAMPVKTKDKKKGARVMDDLNPFANLTGVQDQFQFDPNVSDPFKPYIDEVLASVASEQTIDTGHLGPLEKHPLGQYKLVGIVTGNASPMALLEAPNGKGYTITLGSVVGRNLGVVKAITRHEVVIEEELQQVQGPSIKNKEILTLRHAESDGLFD